jgi:L-alanine-DL-glutamate epimerase-like enolase superfamily enzyme
MVQLTVRHESWPLAGSWTISRDSVTTVEVVVVELAAEGAVGRGECRPYPRYGESVEGVIATIEGLRDRLAGGLDRIGLQDALPAGAARNALDCAFWDLEAKRSGHPVWRLLGLSRPEPVTTVYSLSLDSAANMGRAAAQEAERPLLKLKLAGEGDLERVAAVRENAPQVRLVVDANEAWTVATYGELAPQLAVLGVEMIEQPLHASRDQALARMTRPVPLCADESCHDSATLEALTGRYDVINIKLDKTGGLTEALKVKSAAEAQGFAVMVGCMMATSLALAPAFLLAQDVRIVDLDAGLWLKEDRPDGLRFEGSLVHPPEPALWG